MTLLLSALDGRITLKGLLGTGGMGEVHRAWDSGLERPVAVKFVRGGDPREADRLLLEARLQARVEHPNVVRVHDTGTLEGRPCILFQLVEGRTFADLGTEGDWRVRVALAAQAARGLGAAHRTGLVHRDVKPANILVEDTEEGPQARLSDFGLARDEEGGLTRSGLMMGTVDFMAPEQVTGTAPVDFRADIYGLGATLYAVFAGRPPFRNSLGATAAAQSTQELHAATPAGELHPGDLLRRVLEEEPTPITALVPGLPRDLATVIAKAMEKAPERRYATAEALADDLDRVLRGEPILASPVGWMERGSRWARRNPLPARALGAGLLAVLGAIGFVAWSSRRSTLASHEAAQVGAEAKALELRLRLAHLAPAHDLRPVMAKIDASLLLMDQQDQGPASGAVAYARGRVRLLLERLPEARRDLEAAQRRGFKGRELDEALGLVYGKLYQRDLPAVEVIQEPATRERRLAELQREFKGPALAHLEAAGMDPVLKAHIALLHGRYEEARNWAMTARRMDAERTDGTLLAAQIWEREGNDAFNRKDPDRALLCAREGTRVAKNLMEDVRSDPAVPFIIGRLKDLEAVVLAQQGGDIRPLAEEGLSYIDKALALNQDLAPLWLARVSLLGTLGVVDNMQADSAGIRHAEEMVEGSRRATTLAPDWGETHMRLAWSHQNLGNNLNQQGLDSGSNYQDGYRAAMEAFRLQPWNPDALLMALTNIKGEVSAKMDDGLNPKEDMAKLLELAKQWEGFPGVSRLRALGISAEIPIHHGRSVWMAGGDPDPVFGRAMAEYQELMKAEPGQVGHLANLCYAAFERLKARGFSGRPGEDLIREALPGLEAAIPHYPAVPLLKVCKAQLLTARLQARTPGTMLDPSQVEAAGRAVSAMEAALKHPAVGEIRGWFRLAQAEAGSRGFAKQALADFTEAARGMPVIRSPKMGMVRAYRALGTAVDLDRGLKLNEDLLKTSAAADPEPMLLQAVLLRDLGRAEEAERWRQKALAAQPLLAGHPLMRAAAGTSGR